MVSLVVVFFVGGYVALQWIFYHQICGAFPWMQRWRTVLVLWLAAMVAAPFVSRACDRAGMGCAAWWCGVVAYTWMVLVFWFACVTALFWIWNATARIVAYGLKMTRASVISVRRATQTALVVVALAFIWGSVEAAHIQVKEVWIQSPLIPAGARPLRVVQISDLHLGKPRGLGFARRVANQVSTLKPDLVVSTGDFVDATTLCEQGVAAVFREIQAPLGKYAVLGNHEYYTGLQASLAFHEAAGFILLRGQAMTIVPWLALAGVDDPAAHYTRQGGITDEQVALQDVSPHQMVVLLKHQPLVAPVTRTRMDLQLSGHTHGGQFFPLNWFVRLLYPYGSGMHRMSNRLLLYVSRGTGVWGTPVRFFAPPEITVFVLSPPA